MGFNQHYIYPAFIHNQHLSRDYFKVQWLMHGIKLWHSLSVTENIQYVTIYFLFLHTLQDKLSTWCYMFSWGSFLILMLLFTYIQYWTNNRETANKYNNFGTKQLNILLQGFWLAVRESLILCSASALIKIS